MDTNQKPPTLRSLENRPEHTIIPGSEAYSFFEPSTATGNWHIRKLDRTGKHTSGGITTSSLCGNVKPCGLVKVSWAAGMLQLI